MYTAIQELGRKFWLQEMPAGVAAFVIAEFFYKFKSFALECLAFLASWYLLGLASWGVRKLLNK